MFLNKDDVVEICKALLEKNLDKAHWPNYASCVNERIEKLESQVKGLMDREEVLSKELAVLKLVIRLEKVKPPFTIGGRNNKDITYVVGGEFGLLVKDWKMCNLSVVDLANEMIRRRFDLS